MKKFTIIASAAVFMLGVAVGRATTPAVMTSAELAKGISIDELTSKVYGLPEQSFDAI